MQDKHLIKKSSTNQIGEIINNDESKLYDVGQSGIGNSEIAASLFSETKSFSHVEGGFDRWTYQNDFGTRQYNNDRNFSCEVEFLCFFIKTLKLCKITFFMNLPISSNNIYYRTNVQTKDADAIVSTIFMGTEQKMKTVNDGRFTIKGTGTIKVIHLILIYITLFLAYHFKQQSDHIFSS